jgi:hypothetical protein
MPNCLKASSLMIFPTTFFTRKKIRGGNLQGVMIFNSIMKPTWEHHHARAAGQAGNRHDQQTTHPAFVRRRVA